MADVVSIQMFDHWVFQVVTIAKFRRQFTKRCNVQRFHVWHYRSHDPVTRKEDIPKGQKCQCGALTA